MSYLKQLKEVVGSNELNLSSMHDVLQQIGEKYFCNDVELKAQTERVIKKFLTDRPYKCMQQHLESRTSRLSTSRLNCKFCNLIIL